MRRNPGMKMKGRILAAAIALGATLCGTAHANRPGAYTWYSFFQPSVPPSFTSYEMFFTWIDAPSSGFIYPAFNFGFQVGGGYLGMQLEGTTRKALFSIWDVAEGAQSALPVGPTCRRFGDDENLEGTGAQCGLTFAWQPGVEYELRVAKLGAVAGGVRWRATIHDPQTATDTPIGTIELRDTAGHAGYGDLSRGTHTFLEYFSGGPNVCEGQPTSKVQWRGPFANDGTYVADRAWVGGYPCGSQNDVQSPAKPIVVHAAGDPYAITNPAETTLWQECSYPFDAHGGNIQLALDACFANPSPAVASMPGNVTDYAQWTYPNNHPAHDSATAIGNGTAQWAIFYKDANHQGEAFCLAPHTAAQLVDFSGWNDAIDSHRLIAGATSTCAPPPSCTVTFRTLGLR